jgi:transglutaminase-like putative cysteine protease
MIRRIWSEQVRVTFWAWVATLCAAAMLAPLTASKRYLVVGAVGAATISITGALLRSRRAHPLVVLLAELVVAVEWLVLAFARHEAFLGFLPGPDAISELRHRWSEYADFANQYAAPLPENPNVTMAMATVLVGLAVVVDVVAASWRRASLLGLVFLAVYMTPVSILGGEISVVAFLVGAAGYIFLLAADERERLTHWGRQISTAGSLWDRPNEVDEGGLRRNGTRVGLGAIAMAAVVPILVPTLSPHYFGHSGSGGPGGSGGSVSIDEDLVLDLRRNLADRTDEVLLDVNTTDPTPEYFQLAVLDDFTGDAWEVGERDEGNSVSTNDPLPVPTDIEVQMLSDVRSYQVTISDAFDTKWLPLRYYPISIKSDQTWRVDRTNLDAYADSDDDSAGLTYEFSSDLGAPTIGQLRRAAGPSADYQRYVATPPNLPEVFRDLARKHTRDASTAFDKARALESWFRSNAFTYDVSAAATSGSNIEDLVDFLKNSRVGYCEQYASAMAIMARTLDIPSRVVVGFLQPEQVDGNNWVFRGTDMHAWPELHFSGIGWVRFEPTPDTETSEGSEPLSFAGGPGATLPTGPQSAGQTGPSRATENVRKNLDSASGDESNAGAAGGSDIWWIGPSIVLGLALLLSLPRLTRAVVRRRRWSRARGSVATAEAAWAELRDRVVDLRMTWDAGATPRAIGRSLRERLPDDRAGGGQVVAALNRLVLAIEQARYARTIRDASDLRGAQVTVAEALSSRQTSGRRFLARWLPASLWRSRRRTTVRAERLGELLVSVEN